MLDLCIKSGLDTESLGPTPHRVFYSSHAKSEVLRAFQAKLIPDYRSLPYAVRCEVSRWLAFDRTFPVDAETFFHFLGRSDEVTAFDLSESAREGVSILISAASAFGCEAMKTQLCPSPTRSRTWPCFLRHMVLLAPDLNELGPTDSLFWGERQLTPLLSVMYGVMDYHNWTRYDVSTERLVLEFAKSVLLEWLTLLHSCGVDLVNYGAREKGQVADGLSRDFPAAIHTTSGIQSSDGRDIRVPVRLVSFDIGPEPADWHFWLVVEYEIFAQEFWEVVDKSSKIMPGSWVD